MAYWIIFIKNLLLKIKYIKRILKTVYYNKMKKMMFKMLLPLAFSVFLFASCDVRKKDKIAVMPQEEIKDPTTVQMIDSVYDFGSVNEGQMVEHSYQFKNTGT